MSICNTVAYQLEMLFETVASNVPEAVANLLGLRFHEDVVRQDYVELKDTIVNFKQVI